MKQAAKDNTKIMKSTQILKRSIGLTRFLLLFLCIVLFLSIFSPCPGGTAVIPVDGTPFCEKLSFILYPKANFFAIG